MIAVIFEVKPTQNGKDEYLKLAGELKPLLENQKGLISIERFQSFLDEGKLLSLSFWEDETAITAWRNVLEHRLAQQKGSDALFESYRIRVAEVVRDYSDSDRTETPKESEIFRATGN